MISETEAVVIGAGAFGASITYHLARHGRRVTLLDRHAVVSQTSPRAAGLSQQIRADRTSTELAMHSVAILARFATETDQDLSVHQTGSIKMARTPQAAEQIHRDIRRGKDLGLDIEPISPGEARKLAPWLQPEGALALWYTASDLYLEPGDLPRAYIRAAEGLGAAVLAHTAVTAIGTRDGAIERVITTQGEIRTPVVVDTAGAWAGLVGAMTGIRVPMVPTRHQLAITAPIGGVTTEQPIARVLDANVYVRPERGGLLFGGYEPEPLQVDMRTMPEEFQIADLALDFAPLRRLAEEVRDQFPALQDAPIAEFRGGLPTMTADGNYILDQVPGVWGFFIVGGCCVGGLTISPAVGEAMAAWIADGAPSCDLSPYRLTRFDQALVSDERLLQACLWRYAHHYSDAAAFGDTDNH